MRVWNIDTATVTDIGTRKKVNQDSYCVKVAETDIGKIAFALVCDGVGGLSHGEFASAYVVNAFSIWFANELPSALGRLHTAEIANRWIEILNKCNSDIIASADMSGDKLGTTATGILVWEPGEYLIAHIGDSRIYRVDNGMTLLTADHTVTAASVRAGMMTIEQAENDPRKSVLTQCVGVNEEIRPDITRGKFVQNCLFLLCSDGFCHKVSMGEMQAVLSPLLMGSEIPMKDMLLNLTEENKNRGETDNITSLLLRVTV